MSDRPQALALSPFPQSVAAALKHATETIHLRLHRHPLLVQLHRSALSRTGYCAVLEAFHEFYSLWEPRFTGIDTSFDYEARPLGWLAQDFAALGLPVPSTARPPAEPGVSGGLSEALGYLYVKQGSTLGGQQISRHVEAQLGLIPGESQFFFSGYGSRTGLYWKVFLRFMFEVEQRGEIDIEAATASAVSAFQSLESILDAKTITNP